ncbi:ABC transporter ATP-binding protein [Paenibacillus sp. CF384]|uniref:ABC transporter ATP-binding protein n=1 Tax=Paenibacillus sp. CF384 TaxID=1884382 RepID=UPI00089AD269|nr:ABC transporter ATP-binding protein [Paenibacillus sp. CF384]SDW97770.1 carbohydrate ABC transporter ATP-binding protein, CUT1 family [Paenibacillus sp. CF384]
MAAIHLKDIAKTYSNGKTVIEDLNLEIKDRSFTVLLGPSGCGKTTALRMIAGLEEVSAGQLYIGDQNVTKTEPGERGLAMVFQNYAIYPHMTVRRNIEFGLKNMKYLKDEIEKRIKQVVGMVGLQEYVNAKPSTLSGGQRQRIALARAISKKPEVFLMDEPLSNLDAKLRNQMRSELIDLHRSLKSTFVFVTHDQIEAMTMATDIVIFNYGRIMQQGTPKEVYENPANLFVATFIGDPGMNTIAFPGIGTVGFRPQKVKLTMPADFQGAKVAGMVITKEMLGMDHLYHVATGLGTIIMKSEADLSVDEAVQLYISEQDLYFFDSNEQRTADAMLIDSVLNTVKAADGVTMTKHHLAGSVYG